MAGVFLHLLLFQRQICARPNSVILPQRTVPKSIPYSSTSHLRCPAVVMHRHSNSDALVLIPGGVPGQAASRPSHQGEQGNLEPITHAFEVDRRYFHCQEHLSFYPNVNYEVVKATVRNSYTPLDTFHTLNFPIDQLGEHLTAKATQLLNLRSVTFYNPLSWEVFILNYIHITEMALYILTHAPSLMTITLCADMLNDGLFRALSSQLYLREVGILLPTISFHFPNRLAQIGEVLNRGVAQLPQVEHFKIPLELVTGTLLSCLGRLPCLYSLKITSSTNAPYPGRLFIGCMDYLYIQNPRFFGRLQVLDVRDNLPQEDFFSKYTLTKIFPNTKFIKA